MPINTKTRAEAGSLTTPIPAEVARRLDLVDGSELLWVDDGQGGYRVFRGGEKTHNLLQAHEAAISEYEDVFRELAK